MREIKFRAWDTIEKGMWTVVGIEWHTDTVYLRDDTHCVQERMLHKMTLMPFTGLYDKNGKEIYEGDIVKLVNKDGIKHITEIKWHNGRYVTDTWMMFADTLVLHKCEVIGNIYENSELIQ
jgi:hypothetical protein